MSTFLRFGIDGSAERLNKTTKPGNIGADNPLGLQGSLQNSPPVVDIFTEKPTREFCKLSRCLRVGVEVFTEKPLGGATLPMSFGPWACRWEQRELQHSQCVLGHEPGFGSLQSSHSSFFLRVARSLESSHHIFQVTHQFRRSRKPSRVRLDSRDRRGDRRLLYKVIYYHGFVLVRQVCLVGSLSRESSWIRKGLHLS